MSATDLTKWWTKTSAEDLKLTLAKLEEYGSHDLRVMGEAMRSLNPDLSPEAGQEAAVAFYLIGKCGRLLSAYASGILPSDDTWFDIVIYGMMGRRIRVNGEWG